MYKIVFLSKGQVYELFAEAVESSHLVGFVTVSKLLFDTDAGVVIDPTEERMRREFAETEQLLLPMQSVIRIEKVKKRGAAVIRDRTSGEKVTPLPVDGPGRKR